MVACARWLPGKRRAGLESAIVKSVILVSGTVLAPSVAGQ
jgi:hypothetical protein